MNTKIKTEIAVGIIILLAVVTGGAIWLDSQKPVLTPVAENNPAPVRTKLISREEAIRIVSNRPEVIKVKALVEKKGSQLNIAAGEEPEDKESGNPYWTVQVYENLEDHNSTFDWYRVYQKTGKVEALSEDQ